MIPGGVVCGGGGLCWLTNPMGWGGWGVVNKNHLPPQMEPNSE